MAEHPCWLCGFGGALTPAGEKIRQRALEGARERTRQQIASLRGLLDGLELQIADDLPPGPNAAQQVAHAGADIAVSVGRLDTLRRVYRGDPS